MIVENKKNKRQFAISQEDWDVLKSTGKSKLFKVLSTDTFKPKTADIPKEIQVFIEKIEANKKDSKQTKTQKK